MLRPMLRPLLINPMRRIGTPAWSSFSPRSLFAAGEQGAWYDPSDLSTLFQDAGGTTPVTAAGQAVALVRDKSGRANHLTLTASTLDITSGRYSIVANGTTAGGATASINFTGTDKVTIWAGVTKLSDAAIGTICELGASAVAGSFTLTAPHAASGTSYGFRCIGSSGDGNVASALTFPSPSTAVVVGIGSIPEDQRILRVNGAQVASNSADQGSGTLLNAALNVLQRAGGTNRFTGRLYGLIVRGAATTAASIAQTERWMASRTGVVL